MNNTRPGLRILEGPAAVAASAAGEFRARAYAAYGQGKIFTCALSGGTTPQLMYQDLSNQADVDPFPAGFWDSVHFFWGDERDVPPDNPASNYRAAQEMLLDRIAIPANNIHRIMPERGGAINAAEEYEAELKSFFSLEGGEIPRFDLIFLGMGEDGHTASIFPFSNVAHEAFRLASAPYVEKLGAFRITLTLPVINNAACVVFLIAGAEKADAVRQVLGDAFLSERLPAQLIRLKRGELIWLLDRAAASKLPPASQFS
jgi:6-phosphogluconolactonase